MQKSLVIGILLVLVILSACGRSGSPSEFSEANIATKPSNKISSGILFEFIGLKAVQPRTSRMQIVIRVTNIHNVTFAPITFISDGAIAVVQPAIQIIENAGAPAIDIPLDVRITGSGEGYVDVSIDLKHPKNTRYAAIDFLYYEGTRVYFYVTDERIYANLGGMLHLKRQDLHYHYERGRLTEHEYEKALRELVTSISPAVTPAITPTMR